MRKGGGVRKRKWGAQRWRGTGWQGFGEVDWLGRNGGSRLEVSYRIAEGTLPLLRGSSLGVEGGVGRKRLDSSELEEMGSHTLCGVRVWDVGCRGGRLEGQRRLVLGRNFSGIFGLRIQEAKWELWGPILRVWEALRFSWGAGAARGGPAGGRRGGESRREAAPLRGVSEARCQRPGSQTCSAGC